MGNAESRLKVRNQRDSDRCTGYALANLIDLLRIDDGLSPNKELPPRISARMLFEMGRLVLFRLNERLDELIYRQGLANDAYGKGANEHVTSWSVNMP